MKVHVVWSRREHAGLRRNAGLCAYLSPNGKQVLFVGTEEQRVSLYPGAQLDNKPHLQRYLKQQAIADQDLVILVAELHLPGGQEQSPALLQRVVEVLILSEEPPGNEPPPSDLELPNESFYVISQGIGWPGYEKASLEPDGDVIVNHVLMGSVFPPAPPP